MKKYANAFLKWVTSILEVVIARMRKRSNLK